MVLRIVHYNEPVLRKKGEPVARFDAALLSFAKDMIETMHAEEGIGLAAQQVGRAIQMCVMDLREARTNCSWTLDGFHPPLDLCMPLALVNPVVTPLSGPEEAVEEGCLSFPGIRGDVIRPTRIKASFQDVQGVHHAIECDGLFARCIQHEVDHLNGVLFIDRMPTAELARLDSEIKQLKRATKERARKAARRA